MKSTPDAAQPPRVLLVEDDPVSLAFLTAALEMLPAQVDAAASCARARQLAVDHPGHALWLIDANLPDGSGEGLLAALRLDAPRTPALAHTACQHRETLDALIDAGFAEVLVKPLSALALQASVRRALGLGHAAEQPVGEPCGKLPNWDDAAALRSLNGEQSHVAALRQLFLDELPKQRQAVSAALATGDAEQAADVLHQLRASSGFVGAARLASAVQMLEQELEHVLEEGLEQAPGAAQALRRFEDAASDLLAPV